MGSPRESPEVVPCEVCETPTAIVDPEHCPVGECGADPRCAAHPCLCRDEAALSAPCADCHPAHERREHHDSAGRAGDYAGQCDRAACGCPAFRPDAEEVPAGTSAVLQ